MAAVFSVLVVTAPPSGLGGEANGAAVKIDGRETLLRTVELFLNRENVKQVRVAFDAAYLEEGKRKFGNHLGFTGVKLVTSTNRWIDQVAASAEKLIDEATHVIVHDAGRPAVPYTDIDAVMEAAEQHDAVALTAPIRAPLLELDEGGGAVSGVPAGRFVQLLTPQAFNRAKFLEIARTKREPHASQWTLVKGSGLNVRVGGGADASVAKAMIGLLPKPKMKALDNPFEEAQW